MAPPKSYYSTKDSFPFSGKEKVKRSSFALWSFALESFALLGLASIEKTRYRNANYPCFDAGVYVADVVRSQKEYVVIMIIIGS